jgi:hypothetical protein
MVDYPMNYPCIHHLIHPQNWMVHSCPTKRCSKQSPYIIIKNISYDPDAIKWNYIMISSSYVCPPFGCIWICEIRKRRCTWPNLHKQVKSDINYRTFIFTFPIITSVELNFLINIPRFSPSSYGR